MLRFFEELPTARGIRRRQFLQLGAAGLLASGSAVGAETSGPPGFGKARSVVLIFASGGQSHIDMWDPKPLAPTDIRGAFQTISTAVPGVAVCEHMPRIGKVLDRATILRSMSHEDLDHGTAAYLSLTGRYHVRRSGNPPPRPIDFPTYGAVLKRTRPTDRFPYECVHVNGPALVPFYEGPGQNGGFLGREFDPFVVGNPNQAVPVTGLDPQPGLPPVRMQSRRSLKESFDSYLSDLERQPATRDMSELYRQALDVLGSPQCRRAFDLKQEPRQLRDRYGRHRSGQACLLARRLVEAGVPLINVIWNHSNRGQDRFPDDTDMYGWDTHNDIFDALRDRLLPRFDESFSAFIEDMDQRGLLDNTLVICMGEFGRAPRVALEPNFAGATPGRKHWAASYSVVLAGAGVGRGAVVGATDRLGAEPTTKRYGPWDLAATMYSALGIDPRGHFTDSLDRSFPISIGRPVEEVYR